MLDGNRLDAGAELSIIIILALVNSQAKSMVMVKQSAMVISTLRVKFSVKARVMVRSGCLPLHDPHFPSQPSKVRLTFT